MPPPPPPIVFSHTQRGDFIKISPSSLESVCVFSFLQVSSTVDLLLTTTSSSTSSSTYQTPSKVSGLLLQILLQSRWRRRTRSSSSRRKCDINKSKVAVSRRKANGTGIILAAAVIAVLLVIQSGHSALGQQHQRLRRIQNRQHRSHHNHNHNPGVSSASTTGRFRTARQRWLATVPRQARHRDRGK